MWDAMGPLLTILAAALALFALFFIWTKSSLGTGMKVVWTILALIPFVGAVAYFLLYGTNAPPSDSLAHDGRSAVEKRNQT